MTRQERLEKKGWKIQYCMRYYNGEQAIGSVRGINGNTTMHAGSVTELHRKVFGY